MHKKVQGMDSHTRELAEVVRHAALWRYALETIEGIRAERARCRRKKTPLCR